MFSNYDLKHDCVPLFWEQLLVMLLEFTGSLVVNFIGADAVSGEGIRWLTLSIPFSSTYLLP